MGPPDLRPDEASVLKYLRSWANFRRQHDGREKADSGRKKGRDRPVSTQCRRSRRSKPVLQTWVCGHWKTGLCPLRTRVLVQLQRLSSHVDGGGRSPLQAVSLACALNVQADPRTEAGSGSPRMRKCTECRGPGLRCLPYCAGSSERLGRTCRSCAGKNSGLLTRLETDAEVKLRKWL